MILALKRSKYGSSPNQLKKLHISRIVYTYIVMAYTNAPGRS